ncbi:mitochondrial import inner membrane translocase subunit Tim16 isoform X2 [Scaptodrosophila lebanonensis]|uniref:Mitochondrial import inner membrane translocase subunit Tim16 isoform X2 n=1 Tax=Drosophila lebanonensis TaxID=7225 RepID=A0A6J2TUD9_DROLE|nr:mitochondrial import inner membrane translocase subunit Tim16 isoform X2 [Scaptodrosophila lebanonensis]
MAKHFARIIIYGAQSVGRAFAKAIRQEIEASREAARQRQAVCGGSSSIKNDVAHKGMTLFEAQQILNVKNLDDREEIHRKFIGPKSASIGNYRSLRPMMV